MDMQGGDGAGSLGANGQVAAGLLGLGEGLLCTFQGQFCLGDLVFQGSGVDGVEHIALLNGIALFKGAGGDLAADGGVDGIGVPVDDCAAVFHQHFDGAGVCYGGGGGVLAVLATGQPQQTAGQQGEKPQFFHLYHL